MKRIPFLAIAGCAACALAADAFHIEDAANHYTLDARSGAAGQPDAKTQRYPFLLKGNARAATPQIRFEAETVRGVLGPDAGLKGAVTLLSATASGNVRAIRTVHVGPGLRVTTLTGSSATYQAVNAEGRLSLLGPVSLTDTNPDKRTSIAATGKRGSAVVDLRPKARGNGLLGAKIEQSVKVDIVQSSSKAHVTATGDTMTLNNRVEPPTLTLSGHVTTHGSKGSSVGIARLDQITMQLNDRGEMVSWQGSSGS